MKVIHTTGYAISKNVDVVVNSANGYLLLDSSGAGAIRKRDKALTKKQKLEYYTLLENLPKQIQNYYVRTSLQHKWEPTLAQLSCLHMLLSFPNNKVKRGEVLLDEHTITNKKIIHAIAMSYSLGVHSRHRLPATSTSLKLAYRRSFALATLLGATSIALPVMAARPSYGLGPRLSYAILKKEIERLGETSLKRIVICFDNDISHRFAKKYKLL